MNLLMQAMKTNPGVVVWLQIHRWDVPNLAIEPEGRLQEKVC